VKTQSQPWYSRKVPWWKPAGWAFAISLYYNQIVDWLAWPNGQRIYMVDAIMYYRAGKGVLKGLQAGGGSDWIYGEVIRWPFVLLSSIFTQEEYAIIWRVLVSVALFDMVRRLSVHPIGFLVALFCIREGRLYLHSGNIEVILAWFLCVPSLLVLAPVVKFYLLPLALGFAGRRCVERGNRTVAGNRHHTDARADVSHARDRMDIQSVGYRKKPVSWLKAWWDDVFTRSFYHPKR
jgi:hypothetical protein